MTYPNVLLADNCDISHHAFNRGVDLRRKIAHAVESRDTYVAEHRLDPLFCLPSGNWGDGAQNDFLSAYEYMRDGGYDVLNRLRFRVPFFSGYDLMWLTPAGESPRPSIAPIPPNHDQWVKTRRAEPDSWVELWLKFTGTIPTALRFSPPVMLGEIGWRVDGVCVNHDTYVYQERINILYESGIVDWLQGLGRPPRILEIGGGYGAVAFALKQIFPSASYMICDLPESLIFSGLYLTLCEQDQIYLVEPDRSVSADPSRAGIALLPNYMLHILLDRDFAFDLVINTLSLSEMTEFQVHTYAEAIARLIGRAGLFIEQNQDNTHLGLLNCKDHIRRHFAWSRRLEPLLAANTEGSTDLWANVAPQLNPIRVRNPIPKLLGSIDSYNIVDYDGFIYGLPQALGPIDLAQADVEHLKDVIRHDSREKVEAEIRARNKHAGVRR